MPTTRDRETTANSSLFYGPTRSLDRRPGNTEVYLGSGGEYVYQSLGERIEDETPKFKRTGSVKHVKVTTSLGLEDFVVYDTSTPDATFTPPFWREVGGHGSHYGNHYYYGVLPRPTLADHLTDGRLRSFTDVGALAGFSWAGTDMDAVVLDLQRSDTKVDLLVNLIEASQLKGLVKEAPKLARALLSKLARSSTVLQKVSWRDRFKGQWESTKDASNLFLGYEFGVVPLLSDVMALKREISNATATVASIKKRANKPHTWRKTTVQGISSETLSPYASYMWHSQKVWNKQPTTCCSVRYIDRMKFQDSVISDIGIMARRLGVVPRFEAAWELVPFSFVVDWLFGIGKIAELLDNKISYLNTREILECSVSRAFSYQRSYFSNEYFYPSPYYNGGNTEVTYYSRDVVTPSGLIIPPGSGFGKMKAALTGALLRQKDFGKPSASAAKSAYRLSMRAKSISRLNRQHPRARVYNDLQQSYSLLMGR